MGVLLIVLGALMLSNVPYALVPKLSFKSPKGVLVSLWLFGNVLAAIMVPAYFFFPMLLGYTAWGLFGSVIHGLLERLPDRDPLEDSFDDAGVEMRPVDYGELAPDGLRRPIIPIHPDDMGERNVSRFRLEIRVIPRPGLLDPEGKAIQNALHSLDYEQVP